MFMVESRNYPTWSGNFFETREANGRFGEVRGALLKKNLVVGCRVAATVVHYLIVGLMKCVFAQVGIASQIAAHRHDLIGKPIF